MRKPEKQRLDRRSIERANGHAIDRIKHYIKTAGLLSFDPERESRLADRVCVACRYLPRLNGNANQTVECAICKNRYGRDCFHGDPVCGSCAKANGLCRKCGADIELKSRRKPYPFEKQPEGERP